MAAMASNDGRKCGAFTLVPLVISTRKLFVPTKTCKMPLFPQKKTYFVTYIYDSAVANGYEWRHFEWTMAANGGTISDQFLQIN